MVVFIHIFFKYEYSEKPLKVFYVPLTLIPLKNQMTLLQFIINDIKLLRLRLYLLGISYYCSKLSLLMYTLCVYVRTAQCQTF